MSKSNIVRGNLITALAVRVSLNLPNVGAATTAEQTISVPGVKTGDMVFVSIDGAQNAGYFTSNSYVSATDVVTVRFGNTTAGAIDPGTFNVNMLIVRPEYTLASV